MRTCVGSAVYSKRSNTLASHSLSLYIYSFPTLYLVLFTYSSKCLNLECDPLWYWFVSKEISATQKSRSFSRANRPFYSCLFSVLAFEQKRGWAWLCFSHLFFSCPCGQVSMTRTWFRRQKRWGLYQNKVNPVRNCKWAFTKETGASRTSNLEYWDWNLPKI